MGMAIRTADNDHRPVAGEANVFDKLRELTRSGYVPDASAKSSGGGILLSHPHAPDLILQSDGTIDLPLGQTAKPSSPSPANRPRMSKLRTLMIIIFAVIFWFFSAFVTASILEGM
jgi:hypothetical protein